MVFFWGGGHPTGLPLFFGAQDIVVVVGDL